MNGKLSTNPQLQIFCALAIGRRLLTPDQCDLLNSFCNKDVAVLDIVAILESHGIPCNRDGIKALALEVSRLPIGATRRRRVVSAPPEAAPAPPGGSTPLAPESLAIEWFFFLAVARGLIGSKACKALVEGMDEPLRLRALVGALRKLGTPPEPSAIEDAAIQAREHARAGRHPPTSLLSEHFDLRSHRQPAAVLPCPSKDLAPRESPTPTVSAPIPRRMPVLSEDTKPVTLDRSDREARVVKKRVITGRNLAVPHPLFPSLNRETIYDLVCGMYLECLDSDAVARDLSAARGASVTAFDVEMLRREAADDAAPFADIAIRRKWAWRHKAPTLDNLAREYQFLIEGKDIQTAKRELAAEIAWFMKSEPPDRLLLAVNDALGRSDIEWQAILEFAAYHESATRLHALARPLAEQGGVTVDAFLQHAAQSFAQEERASDRALPEPPEAIVARLLGVPQREVKSSDLTFLRNLNAAGYRIRSGR